MARESRDMLRSRRAQAWAPAALLVLACSTTPQAECDAAPGLDAAGCALAHAMKLPDQLPAARGNAYGDSEDAATLGFQLFFRADVGSGVSCATCHDPTFSFTDRLPLAKGKAIGIRNAPTTLNAARLRVIFWDGRADSLWSQPLFAIENPTEMRSGRLDVAQLISGDTKLKELYERAFGAMPDLTSFPPAGKPGDPAYDALSDRSKDTINRIAANVGKGFEAYQRKNSSGQAPLDRYLEGDGAAIIPLAKKGLGVFVRAGCSTCHAGPMLTDERFHSVALPGAPTEHDSGALEGMRILDANVFNLAGPYADQVGDLTPLDRSGAVDGAFRTPSLRLVAQTAPYGHDGRFATLDDLLAAHAMGTSEEERGELLAFLRTLSGDLPARPWSTWPSPQ